ncbi:4-phosphopantetheinyl transferase family protein [Mucilaginibacter mali]|uniref:4-phosphopantetheinyl transferase family protein n=1 Tax=Mucilaginibacter mali TaxID=2740462 RepID=A0A7D4QI92_9SPHI|nr:4'-phosphopantetheinyl transferase superfamily protein [Mucilaginibacter mali]QKJ32652.1 4-phosphopantetheinyl transferase family protein [Mucilaginibacter mali]
MNSIGNDIIALNTIDTARTRNPRFYKKILAETEQQLYYANLSHIPLEQFVWLLWSVKEAAYKCLQRLQPDLVFSPVKTVVISLDTPVKASPAIPVNIVSTGFDDDASFRATISFQNQTLYSRSIIYGDEVLHTVASFNPDLRNIHWGIKRIDTTDPQTQSSAVRQFLLADPLLSYNKNYSVEKSSSGYPFITAKGKNTGAMVSLSHHGEWVGYAVV